VPPDSSTMQRVYVTARPQDAAAARANTDLRFWVEDTENGERAYRDATFNGREN